MLILSKDSMVSEWVKTEIAKARKQEVQEKWRELFPVRVVDFGACAAGSASMPIPGKDSAREIREYFIPDFSKWRDDGSYQEAFDRLLNDLRQVPGPRTSPRRKKEFRPR